MRRSRQRKRTRLAKYDYSGQGYYCVTICVNGGEEWFGQVKDGEMVVNDYGEVVRVCWQAIPHHYGNVGLDEWIIMPNHLHGIIVIGAVGDRHADFVGDRHACPLRGCHAGVVGNRHAGVVGNRHACSLQRRQNQMLSRVIGSFKSAVTRNIRMLGGGSGFCWQRSYYDHIIRREESLYEIRKYIRENPKRWYIDKENKSHGRPDV